MKVKTKKTEQKFNPIKLEITIESQDELDVIQMLTHKSEYISRAFCAQENRDIVFIFLNSICKSLK